MASAEASKAPNKVYGTFSKLPAISEGVVFTKCYEYATNTSQVLVLRNGP